MSRNTWMDEIQKNVSDLIARSPAADVQRNVKSMLTDAFGRLDLVTRDEFDIQAELLVRTRARLDALEAQVRRLEAGTGTSTLPPTRPEGDLAS